MIGDDVEVSVLSVMGEKVRIGIQAPQEIPVFRKEIYVEIHGEDADGALDDAKRSEVHDALRKRGEDYRRLLHAPAVGRGQFRVPDRARRPDGARAVSPE